MNLKFNSIFLLSVYCEISLASNCLNIKNIEKEQSIKINFHYINGMNKNRLNAHNQFISLIRIGLINKESTFHYNSNGYSKKENWETGEKEFQNLGDLFLLKDIFSKNPKIASFSLQLKKAVEIRYSSSDIWMNLVQPPIQGINSGDIFIGHSMGSLIESSVLKSAIKNDPTLVNKTAGIYFGSQTISNLSNMTKVNDSKDIIGNLNLSGDADCHDFENYINNGYSIKKYSKCESNGTSFHFNKIRMSVDLSTKSISKAIIKDEDNNSKIKEESISGPEGYYLLTKHTLGSINKTLSGAKESESFALSRLRLFFIDINNSYHKEQIEKVETVKELLIMESGIYGSMRFSALYWAMRPFVLFQSYIFNDYRYKAIYENPVFLSEAWKDIDTSKCTKSDLESYKSLLRKKDSDMLYIHLFKDFLEQKTSTKIKEKKKGPIGPHF